VSDQQNLQIAVTILVGVAVSCAALYWQRNRPLPPSDIPHAAAIASVATESAATAPALNRPAPPPATTPEAVHPAPKPKPDEIPGDNYAGDDLPVVFAISERTIYTTEEKADGELVNVTKRVKEGVISNSSEQLLTITATEVDIPTQESSTAQIILPAGAQKHFGTDQGLKMISGDQITLRSRSYRNLVQLIP